MPLDANVKKNNTVLNAFRLKNEAPDFSSIDSKDFKEAVSYAIAQSRENIVALLAQEEAPSFENTLVKLEEATELYDVVTSLYFNLLHINKDDDLDAVKAEITSMCQEFASEISYNADLFKRVKAVYDQKSSLSLNDEEAMILEGAYKDFVQGGANLPQDQQERLKEVKLRLSLLSQEYSDNVLNSTNAYQLFLTDKNELSGLPEWYIASAAEAAKEAGRDGEYLITLDFPSYYPVMQSSTNRTLREKLWKAYAHIGNDGTVDNKPVAEEILKLRQELANILGFNNFADYVLDDRMAASSDRVFNFLKELKDVCYDAAKEDLESLKALAAQDGISDFEPWDSAYYAEKLKQKEVGLSDEDLRPYYKFENVLEGVFQHASSLFSLSFEENKTYTTYDKDVRAFDVIDTDSGDFVGTIYTDFFPRKNKSGGAWETSYRRAGIFKGKKAGPIVSIAGNFTKPTSNEPSLLTQNEVETLFHEMGHALHDLLSQTKYRAKSGTSVKWDFVELPSQVQENWTYERETLDKYASHVKTGEKMPEDLYQKLRKSSEFMKASFRLRQVSLAMLDMKLYTADLKDVADIAKFESEVMKEFNLLSTHGTLRSTNFSHIFAGGYAAGYYSYQWAELLDADAFEAFKENGLYDKKTADALKRLYAQGGSRDPNDLYKEFRGRDADPKAMLRRDGYVNVKKVKP